MRQVLALLVLSACRLDAEVVVLNSDGAWNWLQDERAVIWQDRLMVASVALGGRDPARRGAVEVASYDFATRKVERAVLRHDTEPRSAERWADDHCCPALLLQPDGRLLALYSRHGQEASFYRRVAERRGPAVQWSEETVIETAPGSRVTFPNLAYLAEENDGRGRTYAFFRGIQNRMMPSVAAADAAGRMWQAGSVFMTWPTKATPYVKYASDGRATIHLAWTDGHRVDFNNAVFHVVFRDGQFWRANGERVSALEQGIRGPQDAMEVFRANANSVAMISDLALDAAGRPAVVYSVQRDTKMRRPRPVGADHRYRYARWDGDRWHDDEIAHAGTETHDAPDDDCTGLAAIDPDDVSTIYISTNAHPTTGEPLVSRADGARHWEIFRGRPRKDESGWKWEPVTENSTADNLRPIVPAGSRGRVSVIWLRGTMRLPKQSSLEVVALLPNTPRP